jgi:NTE family protein
VSEPRFGAAAVGGGVSEIGRHPDSGDLTWDGGYLYTYQMYNVAIACQGGGSHTAFTAGVLQAVLPWIEQREDCRLVGLSGTSGGAVSALAGWYGHLDADSNATTVLGELWADVAARRPSERLFNELSVWGLRLRHSGVPTPAVSPYHHPFSGLARRDLRRILERHVDFDRIPDLAGPGRPRLIVGTIDINAGEFETFTGEAITPEAVLASAAVPTLFEAVEIDGHYHWDGLLSQNPPVYDLMHTDPERKPDELWVIQINPQTRDDEPTTLDDIADRRNELSGNLSLNQELRFVERVNEWLDRGHLPAGRYSHTEIRRIDLDESLGYASKFDRGATFLEGLIERGRDTAERFLADVTPGAHEHDVQSEESH